GLQDPNRPIGSFLFLGPTGVGKTELARALAEFLFDDEQAMVRIDMSEYQEKHTVSRMIGAPPGYVGYEEAGQLTEAVRRRPYAVVLFDEVEKAHAEVVNVLLQLLDDGRLTDGKGRTIDFKNTVVIMTSNLGSQFIAERSLVGSELDTKKQGSVAGIDEGTRRQVMEALRAHFRPEFLNRIDEIIFFHALSRDHLKKIIDIQISGLMKRLAERKIHVELTDAAKEQLVREGYDQTYGAPRPPAPPLPASLRPARPPPRPAGRSAVSRLRRSTSCWPPACGFAVVRPAFSAAARPATAVLRLAEPPDAALQRVQDAAQE